jgi:hypothetical protein
LRLWNAKAGQRGFLLVKSFFTRGKNHLKSSVGFASESLNVAGGAAMKNRVRALQKERGRTQVDFGNRLGVPRQIVYAIESGVWDPSLPPAIG